MAKTACYSFHFQQGDEAACVLQCIVGQQLRNVRMICVPKAQMSQVEQK